MECACMTDKYFWTVRVQYAHAILLTKIVSRALYAAPAVRVKGNKTSAFVIDIAILLTDSALINTMSKLKN